MSLWQWERVWLLLVGLGAIAAAPSPKGAKMLALGAESPLFMDRPDFFDYPDSDQGRLLALAWFIGEKPVTFNADPNPGFFHRILVGALALAFFFLLLQLCTHVSFQKGA